MYTVPSCSDPSQQRHVACMQTHLVIHQTVGLLVRSEQTMERMHSFLNTLLFFCSPAVVEKRWTVFSSLWYLVMQLKYFGIPPAVRFIWYLLWRQIQQKAYEVHKALVLWRK